ncbi:uncharacterized protein PAC_10208 [Phialocephala subalpina]|uniref:Uncharacterized protein n=1 Tax=Phialocephala subalpina TaxID=576137 RepID=A0A1L7X5K8_9HELO|nr:uncharacterized protein PAC_10208 [Phialocephala subalpina]
MDIPIAYTSVYEDIWRELRRGHRHRIKNRRRPTREDFERVVEAFYQAEWCPESAKTSFEVMRYRAEYNIWAYYFREDEEFPGRDPATFNARGRPFEPTMPSIKHESPSSLSETPCRYGMFGLTSPEARAVEAQAARDPFIDRFDTQSPSCPPLLSPTKLRTSNASTSLPYDSMFSPSEPMSNTHERKRRDSHLSTYPYQQINTGVPHRSASPSFSLASPTPSRRQPDHPESFWRRDREPNSYPSERPSNPHKRKRLDVNPRPHERGSTYLPDPIRDTLLVSKQSGESLPSDMDIDEPLEPSAALMRFHLESKWKTREAFKDYQPQLGFNPQTGEPWMAIRCYAEDAYPALSGQRHRYLLSLKKKIPKFEIQYERFEVEKDWGQKYLVIWPEFMDPDDLNNEQLWEEFGELRAFLESWAAGDKAETIYQAYNKWLKLPKHERRGLELPEDFPIEDFQLTTFGGTRERVYHGRKDMRLRREGSRGMEREGGLGGYVKEGSRGREDSREGRDERDRGRDVTNRRRVPSWEEDRFQGLRKQSSRRDRIRAVEREGRHGGLLRGPSRDRNRSRGREQGAGHASHQGRNTSRIMAAGWEEGQYTDARERSSRRDRSRIKDREGIQGPERNRPSGPRYYVHGELGSEQRYRGRQREGRQGENMIMRDRSRPRDDRPYDRFDPPYNRSSNPRYL